jgi:hypothetical protein
MPQHGVPNDHGDGSGGGRGAGVVSRKVSGEAAGPPTARVAARPPDQGPLAASGVGRQFGRSLLARAVEY